MQVPVSEYAMRCEKLGIDFANEGEIIAIFHHSVRQ